ncbi:MAG: hypothetical protein IIA68_03840 [Proteobacteria bacterium]|nr:hypothetical protein [Pseudomonadota bacterium]
MFQSKTLFVVGAGASQEARLPTGNELTDTIANKVDIQFGEFTKQFRGSFEIARALTLHVEGVGGQPGDVNDYFAACRHIRDAMPQASSIDDFIDHQGDDKVELCGKLAIVHSILEAEKNSLLFVNEREARPTLNFDGLDGTWYKSFMQILIEGSRKENINQLFEGMSFITFNYDRCIEHFLFHALQNYYRIKPDEAANIMQGFKILHPYGMVGRMQWQGEAVGTAFGADVGGRNLLSLAGEIKTYTERIEDEEAITEMRQVVQEAETIVFLGFAFHQQNMRLIKPAPQGNAKRIFATAKGISQGDSALVTKQIKNLFGTNPRVYLRHDLFCFGLFDEFRRSLSPS